MKVLAVATAIVTGLSVGVVAAAPASADVLGYRTTTAYIGGGSYVNVRTAPSLSAPIAYTKPNNSSLQILCQAVGSKLGFGPYADNRTFDLLGGADSGRWVHDVVTTTPGGTHVAVDGGGYTSFTPSIPRCGQQAPTATRESKAVDFARTQLGSGSYAGLCERFVENSFGTSGQFYSATTAYNTLNRAGQIHRGTDAPAGALLFYSTPGQGPDGHVSLSIGSGQSISSFGYVGSGRPIRQVGILDRGLPYLGWAFAPSGWPGR